MLQKAHELSWTTSISRSVEESILSWDRSKSRASIRKVSPVKEELDRLINRITDHIFVFNLRSYDRLNKTPALKKQEEISGVKYQDIQRAHAEEIMSSGLHPTKSEVQEEDGKGQGVNMPADISREDVVDQKRKFEAQRDEAGLKKGATSVDSIAKDAMLNGGKVSDEMWEGDPEAEKENFVQEELYIHAKLCIVDDRIAICGSSNLNDRVSTAISV